MLLIDDEADNASINTNKEDLDPTRTNAMIRQIIGLFAKSCYVGYTATPFANIFINPDAYDDDVQEELFPRDFIYCLDALRHADGRLAQTRTRTLAETTAGGRGGEHARSVPACRWSSN